MKKIILSDVDGTLVKGSVVLGHAVHLHRQGVIDTGDLASRWLKSQKNEELISRLAEAYRQQIVGKTEAELNVEEYVDSVVSSPTGFYSTLGRIRAMKKAGAEVVLVSGSPSFLVDKFAERYGFRSIASRYEQDRSGRFTGECRGMFSGEAKRAALKGIKLERYNQVIAFGDTRSDTPLFEKASYSVLVAPNQATRKALADKVDEIVLR